MTQTIQIGANMGNHQTFILMAIKRAKKSAQNGGYPFGAVVVKDGDIVGKSNIDDQEFDPTAHAELSAIRNACKNLKVYNLTGCKIYSSCHPCQLCLGAIKWVGIKDIFYAMDKNDAQAIGYADDIFMDDSVVLSKTKMQDENILVFMKNWYAQRNGQ
ncbi:nucleoside deaminase [Budvicia aquatica]|uniref:Nucleoside deaminase n=2 Tax=Budvicia aquatica TaxID=82979 RepID=A0A2C6DRA3_9GAMM|nr:nucleoside deaminase [Budvicia aquatica]